VRTISETLDQRAVFRRALEEDGLVFCQCGVPAKINPCFRAEMVCTNLIIRLLDQLGLIAPLQKPTSPQAAA
jgi:hypothetical protein